MKAKLVLLVVVLAAFCSDIPVENLRTDQVRFAYEEPTNVQHRRIYDRLKELQVLERLSEFLKPLRFPRTLTLKTQGCDGRVNAYYWDYEVRVCYEYFDLLLNTASRLKTRGLAPLM